MPNDKKCSSCDHYDPILRGQKETRAGWCVKNSLYPYMDSPGQVTPPGAQRVGSPEDPAKPCIVQATEVRPNCMLYAIKKAKPNKADLMAQALGGKR